MSGVMAEFLLLSLSLLHVSDLSFLNNKKVVSLSLIYQTVLSNKEKVQHKLYWLMGIVVQYK